MTLHLNTHGVGTEFPITSCVNKQYCQTLYHRHVHTKHLMQFLFAYAWPANFQCVCFVMVTYLDSCSWPVGEFLVLRVDTAFPLLTLWEQGAGPVRWFSSETIMCWFTVRGCALHSHCFLLTGKWHSGLPYRGSVWRKKNRGGRETDGWCERWWYLRSFALNVRQYAVSFPGSWRIWESEQNTQVNRGRMAHCVCSFSLERLAADSALKHLRWDCWSVFKAWLHRSTALGKKTKM